MTMVLRVLKNKEFIYVRATEYSFGFNPQNSLMLGPATSSLILGLLVHWSDCLKVDKWEKIGTVLKVELLQHALIHLQLSKKIPQTNFIKKLIRIKVK